MKGGTFKQWGLVCSHCTLRQTKWGWSYDMPFLCEVCGDTLEVDSGRSGQTVMISTDDIPGGLEVRHLDSTPKRYYSKTEIKRRANEKGVTILGDTPKPYKVAWSGKREKT